MGSHFPYVTKLRKYSVNKLDANNISSSKIQDIIQEQKEIDHALSDEYIPATITKSKHKLAVMIQKKQT